MMKKLIAVLLSVVTLFALTACSGGAGRRPVRAGLPAETVENCTICTSTVMIDRILGNVKRKDEKIVSSF